jgi:hypothetical protein
MCVLDDRSAIAIYLRKFLPITKTLQHPSRTSIPHPGLGRYFAIQHEVELQFFSDQ